MESYVSLGMALPLAVEKVDESLGLNQPEPVAEKVADVVTSQNDASLARLNALMGGVTVR